YELPLSDPMNFDDFYSGGTSDWPTLQVLEERYIRQVLIRTGGKKEKAAKILGINRRTLYRKEIDYSISDGSDGESVSSSN
ncbi:MAG: helix-turn-helix domain-containing protein, partial [Bdellovibrionales bacterium]|nr:helix-turn-helix domain-containing protein [Bdellovibrionales bacterium]